MNFQWWLSSVWNTKGTSKFHNENCGVNVSGSDLRQLYITSETQGYYSRVGGQNAHTCARLFHCTSSRKSVYIDKPCPKSYCMPLYIYISLYLQITQGGHSNRQIFKILLTAVFDVTPAVIKTFRDVSPLDS